MALQKFLVSETSSATYTVWAESQEEATQQVARFNDDIPFYLLNLPQSQPFPPWLVTCDAAPTSEYETDLASEQTPAPDNLLEMVEVYKEHKIHVYWSNEWVDAGSWYGTVDDEIDTEEIGTKERALKICEDMVDELAPRETAI